MPELVDSMTLKCPSCLYQFELLRDELTPEGVMRADLDDLELPALDDPEGDSLQPAGGLDYLDRDPDDLFERPTAPAQTSRVVPPPRQSPKPVERVSPAAPLRGGSAAGVADHEPTRHQKKRRYHKPNRVGRLVGWLLLFVVGGLCIYGGYTLWQHRDEMRAGDFDGLKQSVEDDIDNLGEGVDKAGELAESGIDSAESLIEAGPGDFYKQRVEVRPDGTKVVIWVPRDEAKPTLPARGRDAKPAKVEAPKSAGAAAPNIVAIDHNGKVFRLSDHRGKVVIVNFYATWCPPCRAEIPEFSRFYRDAGSNKKDVVLVGLVFGSGDRKTAVSKSRSLGVDYPVLMGKPSMAKSYGVRGYPTTVVIGPDGQKRATKVGQLNASDLATLARQAK